MSLDQWITEIRKAIASRFDCCDRDELTLQIERLATRSFQDIQRKLQNGVLNPDVTELDDARDPRRAVTTGFATQVLMVTRADTSGAGFRTILFAQVAGMSDASAAILWCANVRDVLPEPAAADLYLFLDIENASIEDCLRLEADEQYCRKHVLRPGETCESFIARTFLATPVSAERSTKLADPLLASLAEAGSKHDWFSLHAQEAWRSALLSGDTGTDLAERLLAVTLGDGQ